MGSSTSVSLSQDHGTTGLDVGIAYDLKPPGATGATDDAFEEYDSETTVEAIADALRANGHRVRLLGGGKELVRALMDNPPEMVFNMAEGFGSRGREAHVPAVCEMLGIAYTGSDPLTMAATLDKPTAKRIAAVAGVATPAFEVVDSVPVSLNLRFPVIAKPAAEGSGMGITQSSRCEDLASLRTQVGRLLEGYRQPVLIEEFCPGAELTVGILGTGTDARAIGVMEMVPKQRPVEQFVYSVEMKRLGFDAIEYRPADPADVALVAEPALVAHRALGCRDISRVDLRLDANGAPSFLEINPLPGLAPGWGDVVLVAAMADICYDELIGSIVHNACTRLGL